MFRWLKKNKQTPQTEPDEPHVRAEIEEEVDPALAAEIEKMVILQQLCFIASVCAETVARAKVEERLEENWALSHLRRYVRLRTECIEVAKTITSPFYRAVAINFLIELCMKARDVEDARTILKYQDEKHSREEMVTKYPELVRPMVSDKFREQAYSSRSTCAVGASAEMAR